MNAAPIRVMVGAGGIGRFGRHAESSLADLARPVVAEALRAAGLETRDIQAAFLGNAFGGAHARQQRVEQGLGLRRAAVRQQQPVVSQFESGRS